MEVFYRLFDGEKEVALTDEEPEKNVEYENPNEPTITYYISNRFGGGFTLAEGDRYEEVFIDFLDRKAAKKKYKLNMITEEYKEFRDYDYDFVRVDDIEWLLFSNKVKGVSFYYLEIINDNLKKIKNIK